MKKVVIAILISIGYSSPAFNQISYHESIKPYVDFLESTEFVSPKEYVLKSFEEKDIVVLSERDHREFKQYEMIVKIIQDERFTGNLYTEVGVSNNEEQINDFLLKESLTEEEVHTHLIAIFEDLDMFSLWPNYNYYYLFESIYHINQERNRDEKIQVFPLDLVFSWDSVKCNEQYTMFLGMMEPQNDLPPVINRNAILAKNFIRKYSEEKKSNPKKNKALVIMNTYHGYTRIPQYLPHPTEPRIYSTAEYIYKTFPDITKGILLNYYPTSRNPKLTADGKWDAAFRYTGNNNVGFDFKDTPFGKTKFDMYNFGGRAYETVNFEYIFDGMIFFEPIENFEIAVGVPGIFDDKEFIDEFYRRISIEENIPIEEAMQSERINQYIVDWNVKKVSKIEALDAFQQQIDQWLTE